MSTYTHIDPPNLEVKQAVDKLTPKVLNKLKEFQGDDSGLDYIAWMPSAREGQVRQILRAIAELSLEPSKLWENI